MLQIINSRWDIVFRGAALQTSFDIGSAAKPPFVRFMLLPRKHPIPGTCTGQLLSWIRSNFVWVAWQSRVKSSWQTKWEGTQLWSFQVEYLNKDVCWIIFIKLISFLDSGSPMTVTGGSEVTCDRLVNIIAARLNFSPLTAPLFALYQVNWVLSFMGDVKCSFETSWSDWMFLKYIGEKLHMSIEGPQKACSMHV